MSDLRSDVTEALRKQGAPAGAFPLWEEIADTYEGSGPDAVWDLLDKKVREIRRAAKAQQTEMKAAAGSVTKKGRSKNRR